MNLLKREADMRFTSEEAFNHAWVQQQRKKEENLYKISKEVIENMQNYMDSVNFKRTALTLIASRIPES